MRKRAHKTADAMLWLLTHMKRGKAYDAGELLAEAQRAGHKERTVQLASTELGIEKIRIRAPGRAGVVRWQWVLPDEGDDPARASPALQLVSV